MTPAATALFVRFCQLGFIGVDDENRENLRWFFFARVSADAVVIARDSNPVFTGIVDLHLAVVDLGFDAALDALLV